jgi:ubiquinone/menaquinone biosynthesis C-methylase UbiE
LWERIWEQNACRCRRQKCSGFDIDAAAAEYGNQHFIAENLSHSKGNAEELAGVPDNSADVVVSFETIEHLHHVYAYLKKR